MKEMFDGIYNGTWVDSITTNDITHLDSPLRCYVKEGILVPETVDEWLTEVQLPIE